MTSPIPALSSLEFLPYLDSEGQLAESLQGKVGVYAIFDGDRHLQYIGYSRDVYLSLKQALVRQPDRCHWFKVQTIDRPSRTILEEIRTAWIEENGELPLGNGPEEATWNQAIQVKGQMTPEEQTEYDHPALDEVGRSKVLKKVARRVEAEILAQLQTRGVQMAIRFNPKLKEEGLLDLK